ncbi:21 kDa protein-like [Carica papaya]|uniref:21 kDa protein-like n=1 Tax=Carica papaya TaxID=3649 RepID=UPI000B8C9D34|nr:21 kDa protein-like [Carica papaya]
MRTQNRGLHLLATFLICLKTIAAVDSYYPDGDSGSTNATDYIRSSCGATLYPELCYTSLAGYASAVQKDPARLARVAIGVSLSKARRVAAYVSNISRQADYGGDQRATAALHDCFSNLGDAVEEIRGSLKQMRQLVPAGSEEFRFQMSNVQTWMSAALTDEDTCTDGFEDVSDGPMKSDVCDRVGRVKKFTSNALALVNCYAQTGMR